VKNRKLPDVFWRHYLRSDVCDNMLLVLLTFAIVGAYRRVSEPELINITLPDSEESFSPRRLLKALTKVEHVVEKLPLFDGSLPVSYAGHLSVDGDNSALFYWLFEALESPETAPLIIWMNGGPGCSSMDGLFIELGPLKFSNGKLIVNEHGWNKAGNLLFIDQPVGTGLAFTTKSNYPRNDAEVNTHLYRMLQGFFNLHDNFLTNSDGKRQTREVYLTGESHAGHYIPVLAKYITEMNAKATGNDIIINIAGLAIGNGWIDPFNQYDVSDFVHGLGVISLGQKFSLKQREAACQALIRKGQLRSTQCMSLLDSVIDSTGSTSTGRMVIYDARLTSKASTYPPGHEQVESYLNRKDVRSALHVEATPQPYKECTDPPYNALAHQDAKGATEELAFLLDGGIRVLLFSGQYDVICHHLGTEKMLNKLHWGGRDIWLKASTGDTFYNENVSLSVFNSRLI
jgi:carboxypeptidase D